MDRNSWRAPFAYQACSKSLFLVLKAAKGSSAQRCPAPGAALQQGHRHLQGVRHRQASCTKTLMVEHDSQVISEIGCLPSGLWSENHRNCSLQVLSAENLMDGHRATFRAGTEAGKQLPCVEGSDVFLKIKALGLSLAVYRDASLRFFFLVKTSVGAGR